MNEKSLKICRIFLGHIWMIFRAISVLSYSWWTVFNFIWHIFNEIITNFEINGWIMIVDSDAVDTCFSRFKDPPDLTYTCTNNIFHFSQISSFYFQIKKEIGLKEYQYFIKQLKLVSHQLKGSEEWVLGHSFTPLWLHPL